MNKHEYTGERPFWYDGKLQRESIRYKEVVELADVLGYDIVWQKRRDNR